jgi:hypothetical protein
LFILNKHRFINSIPSDSAKDKHIQHAGAKEAGKACSKNGNKDVHKFYDYFHCHAVQNGNVRPWQIHNV